MRLEFDSGALGCKSAQVFVEDCPHTTFHLAPEIVFGRLEMENLALPSPIQGLG